MRMIASMLVIAALGVEAPALSAGSITSAFNPEVTCTENCEVLCKRCEGTACAKDQCAAACEERRRAICSAFPKSEDFGWTVNRTKFKLPDTDGGLFGGGDERPKTRIVDTRSAPLVHPGEEATGYGLYTYVLLRQGTDRDSHFVKDIVATAPSAADVAPPSPAQTDLMLIPVNPCPADSAKSAADCSAHLLDAVASDLKASYNYEESNTILDELCAKPPKQIAEFCHEAFGKGPFLFTYARPVSKMDPISPPFLFFDFTEHDEAAFGDYINAYEAVLKSDDFTDDSKLNTLQLRILDVYNRARTAADPTVEGAVKLIGLFFPSKEQD